MTYRDPISEGWLPRMRQWICWSPRPLFCVRCDSEQQQDRYRVILGAYGGLGAPFFIKPFLRRSSTAGKIGQKSVWDFCQGCGSFVPVDDVARSEARDLGLPEGFAS